MQAAPSNLVMQLVGAVAAAQLAFSGQRFLNSIRWHTFAHAVHELGPQMTTATCWENLLSLHFFWAFHLNASYMHCAAT